MGWVRGILMMRGSSLGWIVGAFSRDQYGTLREPALRMTIRGRILIGFLIMSVITAAVGAYATMGVRNAGLLVDKTFDESLMSINYARAAATDFAAMRAAFARRWIAIDPGMRAALDHDIEKLNKSLSQDIAIAAERSQSFRAREAAQNVEKAVEEWNSACERLLGSVKTDVNWAALDRHAAKVDDQIDLLVNYTAGDGFLYRQSARAAVARDVQLNIASIVLALLLSALVAGALARRIVGRVAVASRIAEQIAAGKLDIVVPKGGADELGGLLAAMGAMRDNIKSMMEREVAQRRSAQARLADALESSQEGVVVVDANDSIALANAQAVDLLGISSNMLKPGTPLAQLQPALEHAVASGQVLMRRDGEPQATSEALMLDGRWLRVSRSPTSDQGFIVLCSDVSHMKAQERSLLERKMQLEQVNVQLDLALNNMAHGLCMFDSERRLIICNDRYAKMYGLPAELAKPGTPLYAIMQYLIEKKTFAESGEETFAAINTRPKDGYSQLVKSFTDGRLVSISSQGTADGGWVAIHEDITERQKAEAHIAHLARHDQLTDLPNRAFLREELEKRLRRLRHGEKFAVLWLDLDRFKSVNDSLGHPIGDKLLNAVATTLTNCVNGDDFVARLGGDEFAIVQANVGRPEESGVLASRIIERLGTPYEIEGQQLNIGVSVGLAIAPTDGKNADQLLKNADLAMYRAKADGRGSYCFFESEMDARIQARRALELELRSALAAGQLQLYYQPLVSAKTGEVRCFEALLRWFHPRLGAIPPGEFIPLAEESGLIGPLGQWVLRTACAEAAKWPSRFRVAVNLSPIQFKNLNLVKSILGALAASGLPASRLELEITESVLLEADSRTLAILHELHSLGIRIVMDDFGTGFSSLNYLRSFPFDKIKIDQTFVRDMSKGRDSVAIIKAIIDLGRALHIEVVAEGVETEQQLSLLLAEGCTEMQGHYFSKPAPIENFEKVLTERNGRIELAA
jgi:diguanylate cyclase (GGDEF)-like protein/PAS domain S-box-containing protein